MKIVPAQVPITYHDEDVRKIVLEAWFVGHLYTEQIRGLYKNTHPQIDVGFKYGYIGQNMETRTLTINVYESSPGPLLHTINVILTE